ncbi:hypothetical protein LJD49_29305, partial [Escherichia coli]|nr:hypothetical protein [Escherichia coli]
LVQLSNQEDISDMVALLNRYVDEGTSSWHLDNQGIWTRHHLDAEGAALTDVQSWLLASRARQRSASRR